MLRFLVLGLVPGTTFQLGFASVLSICLVLLLIAELKAHRTYKKKLAKASAQPAEQAQSFDFAL